MRPGARLGGLAPTPDVGLAHQLGGRAHRAARVLDGLGLSLRGVVGQAARRPRVLELRLQAALGLQQLLLARSPPFRPAIRARR